MSYDIAARQAHKAESVDVAEMIVGVVEEMDYSTGTPQPTINGVSVELADILRLTSDDSDASDTSDSGRERDETESSESTDETDADRQRTE